MALLKALAKIKAPFTEKFLDRVIEKAVSQEIIDKKKGSLRHPRFMKWRDDKDHTQCTFEAHIREVK